MTRIFTLIPPAAIARRTLGGLGLYLFVQTVMFCWIRLLPAAGVSLAAAALVLYVAWSMQRVALVISSDTLQIRGDLFGRTLPRAVLQVQEAHEISLISDTTHMPTWRTWGTGAPGYLAGWFRLRNGEKALAFITDKTHVVYVPTTRGFSVLLSVSQPQAFLQALQTP